MIRKEWEHEKPIQGGLAIQSIFVLVALERYDGILYVTHGSFCFFLLLLFPFFFRHFLSFVSSYKILVGRVRKERSPGGGGP